jgi:hypothetical protein
MFFGLMLVDAALAAWAVGLMQQPQSPRWVKFVIVLLGVTFAISVSVVTLLTDKADNETARAFGLIAPVGAVTAAALLLTATLTSRRKKS